MFLWSIKMGHDRLVKNPCSTHTQALFSNFLAIRRFPNEYKILKRTSFLSREDWLSSSVERRRLGRKVATELIRNFCKNTSLWLCFFFKENCKKIKEPDKWLKKKRFYNTYETMDHFIKIRVFSHFRKVCNDVSWWIKTGILQHTNFNDSLSNNFWLNHSHLSYTDLNDAL